MTRDESIELVEAAYFGRVREPDLDGLLGLFTGDARMSVYHGDGPPDRFAASPGAGETPLAAYFQYVFEHYRVDYGDFVHCVDTGAGRHACTFRVTLTPKSGDAGPADYANCNFFELRDGKIQAITIYYVNPAG